MYCKKCGKEIADDSVFCRYCGEKQDVFDNHDIQIEADEETQDETYEKDNSSSVVEAVSSTERVSFSQADAVHPSLTIGMKWYNFVVKVQLWLFMACTALIGLSFIDGATRSGASANAIYNTFPAVRTVDIAYAIVLLALAVFAFFTRRSLVRYEARGPKFYLGISYISAFLSVLYALVCSIAANVPFGKLFNATSIGQMIPLLALAIINTVYFGKRKALFA